MTFPIDKTEYEWERFRFSEERTSDSEWRTDDRLLTPERLREDYFVLPANVAWNEAVERDEAHAFADAWDRDRREIERLRAERDQLHDLLEQALNALEWWESTHIADSSPADDEFREECHEALAATKEQSDD